jgi:hypothetical protein
MWWELAGKMLAGTIFKETYIDTPVPLIYIQTL